jgi:hypothetical protein
MLVCSCYSLYDTLQQVRPFSCSAPMVSLIVYVLLKLKYLHVAYNWREKIADMYRLTDEVEVLTTLAKTAKDLAGELKHRTSCLVVRVGSEVRSMAMATKRRWAEKSIESNQISYTERNRESCCLSVGMSLV